jgi:hypothetical protein
VLPVAAACTNDSAVFGVAVGVGVVGAGVDGAVADAPDTLAGLTAGTGANHVG